MKKRKVIEDSDDEDESAATPPSNGDEGIEEAITLDYSPPSKGSTLPSTASTGIL